MLNKPFSESCEQNRLPIRQVLERYLEGRRTLLEIGSGTGQHAIYFATEFPALVWQTSDLAENHSGIAAWIKDSGLYNVLYPLTLDAGSDWPDQQYDLLFSANTLHIMSQSAAEQFMRRVSGCMHAQSVLLLYGPFNYQNLYTSDSNARFDQWLKQRDPASGIKNFEWLKDIADQSGLECTEDFAMPANNRLLVWQKTGG
ncbi:MAG: DUF938 domain-containing protein [Gammaproteobacteria bacterium]|nr:DUF938 domain-containing protein [Gammaproteobacteria bacterium]